MHYSPAVSEKLKVWKSAAEQLPLASVWQRVCEFMVTHVAGLTGLHGSLRHNGCIARSANRRF